MTVETRYYRSDRADVNGLETFRLLTSQTGISDTFTRSIGGDVVAAGASWGIRVWKRTSAGVDTEITGGTPVAIVTRNTVSSGMQSATWDCPLTALNSTDTIRVIVYGRFGIGAWAVLLDLDLNGSDFQTNQLGASQLDAATWTCYYYTSLTYVPATNKTIMSFYIDTATYISRIENFSWTPAAVAVSYGDGLVYIAG